MFKKLTSKLNCSSARILLVRVSINVTKSSLLPTLMVFPSGDHAILIFSPLVLVTEEHLPARISFEKKKLILNEKSQEVQYDLYTRQRLIIQNEMS